MAISPIHLRWLRELTSLPTASGREDRVIAWVRRWAKRRRDVVVRQDRHGNLLLSRRGAGSRRPIYFTAHMDHPAFVVAKAVGRRELVAEFRGGVARPYFDGARVRLHRGDGSSVRGRVVGWVERKPGDEFGADDSDKLLRIKLDRDAALAPLRGEVITWDLPAATIKGDRLRAPACDDLAGAAAALAAFDALPRQQGRGADVRVLLTRGEEVGFLGAIAACGSGILHKDARVIALENSKSFAESPIGGGPIVRVGDYTSTFDPDLTYRVGQVAVELAKRDSSFKWQRKLMPGGTCEASAYQVYGYRATCLCLPLGNYHNMNEAAKRIDRETISVSDFGGLVRLLVELGRTLDDAARSPGLRTRLDQLFARRRHILGAEAVRRS